MPGFHPFERSQIAGLTAVNVVAVLSTSALTCVAFRIIYLAIAPLFFPRDTNAPEPREYVFFHTQLGHYAACLLLGNLCTGVAGLIGFQWLHDQGVTDGSLCTSQGIIMQLGNFTSAYFTIVLAVHTFLTLVLRKRQSVVLFGTFATVGWIGAAVIAFSPLYYPEPFGPLYGTSGIGCGIRGVYPREQFLFHLLPIFATSVVSVILYSLIFLVLRGTLAIRGGLRLNLGPRVSDNRMDTGGEYHRFVADISRSMLWFPVAYIVLLIPYAVTRILTLSGFFVPFDAIAFAFTSWFMLGSVNVFLLYNTFRVLQPAFHTRNSTSKTTDTESFGPRDHFDSESAISMSEGGSACQKYERAVESSEALGRPLRKGVSRCYSGRSRTSSLGLLIPKMVHSHSSSAASLSTLDRAISPISDLNKEIVVEEDHRRDIPNSLRPPPLGYGKSASTKSVPVFPRTTQHDATYGPGSDSFPSEVSRIAGSQSQFTVASVSRVRLPGTEPELSQTISRPSSHSSVSTELPAPPRYRTYYDAPLSSSPTEQEVSGWLSQQNFGTGTSPVNMDISASGSHGPLLSAVASQSSFPSPTLSYYHGPATPLSATLPRPLPPLPAAQYEQRDDSLDDSYRYPSSHVSSSLGGHGASSPPEGRALTRKPSMSAFGVVANAHSRAPSSSAGSHSRQP